MSKKINIAVSCALSDANVSIDQSNESNSPRPKHLLRSKMITKHQIEVSYGVI